MIMVRTTIVLCLHYRRLLRTTRVALVDTVVAEDKCNVVIATWEGRGSL